MKIAFIDKKNVVLRVEYKSLRVDEQKIPLRLLDAIVLGGSSYLENKDILKITKEGVSLLLISARSDNVAIMFSAKSKNPELKLKQYYAQDKALDIAKYFISEKIKSHKKQLLEHQKILDISAILIKIEKTKRIQTLLGIEGSFSKRYFSHYFKLFPKTLHLSKRTKNPPQDPLNSILSFFYMLVYNFITVRLLAVGFEPSIGFLHQPFRSHNALASDFIELFRADINQFVFNLFNNEKLKISDFTRNKDTFYLKYDSRKKIWGSFQSFNQKLLMQLDKEIAIIKKMI